MALEEPLRAGVYDPEMDMNRAVEFHARNQIIANGCGGPEMACARIVPHRDSALLGGPRTGQSPSPWE